MNYRFYSQVPPKTLHHSVKIALIFKELMHSTEVKLFTFPKSSRFKELGGLYGIWYGDSNLEAKQLSLGDSKFSKKCFFEKAICFVKRFIICNCERR
jgi:hypothetical protein